MTDRITAVRRLLRNIRWRDGGQRPRRVVFTPRFVTMLISGLATFALLGMMLVVPVPYAVQGPGPTFDTLAGHEPDAGWRATGGEDAGDGQAPGAQEPPAPEGGDEARESGDAADGVQPDSEDAGPTLISIEDQPMYPATGELRLTTVVTSGGPGYPVRAANVIVGFWDPRQLVQPVEAAIDPSLTQEERDQLSAQQMITSQEHATVAALTDLGYDVPAVLQIVDAAPGSGAEGVVAEGDLITGIQEPGGPVQQVDSYADLSALILATPVGEELHLIVERDGEQVTLPIATTDDGRGRSQLGVFLNADFEMPMQVNIAIDNVGGPSAGLMFALGIIEVLTPGDLTGGHAIAGTGTISLDGRVGPIGGVALKMVGAVSDGAEYFFTPVANCPEVVGNIPGGLQVIAVDTLAEARAAVEAIADGDTAALPACPDPGA